MREVLRLVVGYWYLLIGSSVMVALFSSTAAMVAEAANVNFMVYEGGIAGHLATLEAFEKESGHTVTLTTQTRASLAPGIKQDLEQDHLTDLYQTTSFEMLYGLNGLIRDLTEDVVNTAEYDFDWGNILPVAKNVVTLDGKVYGVPIDSNPVVLLYRKDLIPDAPKTWEDLIAVATKLHGSDLNNDTMPDFGVCLVTESRWQMTFFTIANTIFHYTASKREGFLFDVNTDDTQPMESVIQTDGWRYTMEIMKQLFEVSQQTSLAPGVDMYNYWRNGSCATYIAFPSVAEQLVNSPLNGFDIRGKQGVSRPPGSTKVYNRATKSLETCTPTLCPYEEYGGINRPSYNDDLIQLIVSPLANDVKATLELAAYFSKNVDVRVSGALNPFRSHHWNVSWWLESEPRPWLEEEATAYTETMYNILTSALTTNLPRIPVMGQWNPIFDSAMAEYCRFTPHEASTRTLDEILGSLDADLITTATGLGYSRDELERYIRLDLELPPRSYPQDPEGFPVWGAIIIVLMILLIIAFGTFVAATQWKKGAAARCAPQEGAPCTILVVSVYKCATLWDLFPDQMPLLLQEYRRSLRAVAAQHDIYEVKRIGETNFVLAAKDIKKAASFATKLQANISKAAWTILGDDREEEDEPKENLADSLGCQSEQSHGKSSRSSAKRSKTSQTSQKYSQSHSHARGELLSDFTIAIGLSHGTCRITHDAELNTFDYHGPVVTDAAMLADLGAGHQIFASEAVFDTIPPSADYTLTVLCPWALSTGSQKLYQIRSSQMPKVVYVPTEKSESGGGGALVALEQAIGGLSTKKVAVLALNIQGSLLTRERITNASKVGVMEAVTALHEQLELLVPASRAHTHSSLNGNFVFTFNSTTNVANPTRRAVFLMLSVADMVQEKFPRWQVHAGLAVDQAVVGHVGKHTGGPSLYGPLVQQASLLAGLCPQYGGGSIRCLAHHSLKDELWTTAFVQDLDFVRLPNTNTNHSREEAGESSRSMVMAIMGLKDSEADDEWMYQLEAAAGKDPYSFTNNAFAAFYAGDVEECERILENREGKFSEAQQVPQKDGASRDEQLSCLDHVAYEQLKNLLSTHRDCPEAYVSEQGKYFAYAFNAAGLDEVTNMDSAF